MSYELIILLAMLVTFVISIFKLKLPAGVSLMLAAVIGALVGGEGIPVRHLVEGGFGFIEALMTIATAMIFMKVMEVGGALSSISTGIFKLFHRSPTVLVIALVFFVMFPGMLTGLSSTCVLTTGALAAPILLAMGMPRIAVGSLIAMAAVFGEVAPPISIPVMIIGGGVDMPYIGFVKPLILASFPAAIFTAVYYRFRYLKNFDMDEVMAKLKTSSDTKQSPKVYIPLIFVIVYLIGEITFHEYFIHLGVPLIFIIGAMLGMFTGVKFNIVKVAGKGLQQAMPVMAILIGVGMFLQILTLTGVRGFLAVNALYLPEGIKYLAAVIMPFFGSAYGAASVVGVPLVYVFVGKSELIITAALVLMASLGDLMPPPSLLCAYAAQIVKENNHFKILRNSIIPIIFSLVIGLLILIFAEELATLIL